MNPLKKIALLLLLISSLPCLAQDTIVPRLKGVFFPYPMDRGAKFSVGFTNTTMPYDITEEVHYRVPALDLHLLKRITPRVYADVRANVQVLQNLFTVGPRWASRLTNRVSMAVGNDFGYWFGKVNLEGIRTTGHGYQNNPNVSFGYRFNRRVLLTLRADALMNFGIETYAVETELKASHPLLSGSSYALILEQPFFGNKALTLGFRALYTNFYWQTWTLFETFDRNIFYPQITVGLNL